MRHNNTPSTLHQNLSRPVKLQGEKIKNYQALYQYARYVIPVSVKTYEAPIRLNNMSTTKYQYLSIRPIKHTTWHINTYQALKRQNQDQLSSNEKKTDISRPIRLQWNIRICLVRYISIYQDLWSSNMTKQGPIKLHINIRGTLYQYLSRSMKLQSD